MDSEAGQNQPEPEGKREKLPPVECPECHGTGSVWVARRAAESLSSSGEALSRIDCPVCNGRGTVGGS